MWSTARRHRTLMLLELAINMSWQLARKGPDSRNPGLLAKTAFPANTFAYPNEQILTIPVLTMLKETGYEIRGTNAPAEGGPCLTSRKGAKQVGFTVVEGLSVNISE